MPKNKSKFEDWYTRQFGRLPNMDLIHELKEEVPSLRYRYETAQAALNHELSVLESFDIAMKAYYAAKGKGSAP